MLREPFDVTNLHELKDCRHKLAVTFGWKDEDDAATKDVRQGLEKSKGEKVFDIQLPIDRCVEILETATLAQELSSETSSAGVSKESFMTWQESEKLLETRIDQTDLLPYCSDVILQTRKCQADAAISVLHSALTKMLGVQADSFELIDALGKSKSRVSSTPPTTPDDTDNFLNIQTSSEQLTAYSKDLGSVCLGLMYGSAIKSDQDKAVTFMKGLLTHMFLVVSSHQEHIIRIDANGSNLHADNGQNTGQAPKDPVHGTLFEVGLGSLKPFGYFKQTGLLKGKTDPMVINSSLAKFLSCPYAETKKTALDLLRHLLMLPEAFSMNGGKRSAKHGAPASTHLDRGCLVFFENLLSAMCRECVSSQWHRRDGLYEGITLMIETLGSSWSQRYEIELINVGLFATKSVPEEMSVATVSAFKFLARLCDGLYGPSSDGGTAEGEIIYDVLSVLRTRTEPNKGKDEGQSSSTATPSSDVVQVLLVEITSTRQIVR